MFFLLTLCTLSMIFTKTVFTIWKNMENMKFLENFFFNLENQRFLRNFIDTQRNFWNFTFKFKFDLFLKILFF